MALYSDLTPAEKADFAIYDHALRGIISSLGNSFRQADPDNLNQFSIDRIDPILATITAGAVLPNTSDLAGGKDVTVDEFKAVQLLARSLVTTYKNNRALLVKFAGINVG